MTKEEFEQNYSERGCTIEGLQVVPCTCGERDCGGWRMTVTEPVPEVRWEAAQEKAKWEYLVRDVGLHNSTPQLMVKLDVVGKEGWELVVVIAESVFIFKRRVV